jgi:predicted Ser/Thr protein kinase
VHWLLQSYATEPTISAACQRVITAKQKLDEEEEQFASRLTRYSADAGSVFSEEAIITAYVDGFLPFARNTVRGYVSATMTFAEVQLLTQQAGEASRALVGVKTGTLPLNSDT